MNDDLTPEELQELEELEELEKLEQLEASGQLEQPQEQPESRAGEAALSGFGSGATASFSDELGGVIGAGLETAASYIPGTGAYESRKTDERLREQGITGDLQDKQGLLDKYKESRDYIREYQKGLQEQHPIASGVGEVAGGLVTAPLVPGGAAKGAGTMAKIATGAKQGFAGGAMYGAGASEAELLEGDVLGLAKDTLESGVGGSLVGAGLPAAGSLVKGAGKLIPGLKSAKVGYGYGREGKLLTEENVTEDVKKLGHKIYNGIRNRFNKFSVSKQEALDVADEIGKRVDAGETLDAALERAVERRMADFGEEARESSDKLIKILKEAIGDESRPMAKVREGAEKARARASIRRPDAEIGDVETFTKDGRVAAKFDVTELDPKTRRFVDKPKGVQIGKEELDMRDVKSLKVRELEELMKSLDSSFKKSSDIPPEAKMVLRELRELRDKAISELPYEVKAYKKLNNIKNLNKKVKSTKDTKKMSDLILAREELGIDKILSKRGDADAARKVDKIRQLIGESSDAARFTKDRMYKNLKAADSRFGKDVEARGRQLEDLKDILGMEDIRTQNIKGLAGAASTLVGKGANVAGMTRYGVGKAAKASKELLLKPYEMFKKYSPEQLTKLADSVESVGGAGIDYANQLRKAATGDGKTKTALLHGLYQQPGFREVMSRINIFDEEEDI